MKKNKLYFIIPIVALVCFIGYYWSFSSQYEEKQAAIVAADKARKQEKLKEEAEAREAAIKDAVEAQKQRKAERLAREEKERQERDAKENATLEAEKAGQEAQKLQRQAEKLEKDVATEKDDIVKVQTEEKRDDEQLGFLKQYIAAAQANQAKLAEVMTKIQAADVATARAAALAAAEAKKNQ